MLENFIPFPVATGIRGTIDAPSDGESWQYLKSIQDHQMVKTSNIGQSFGVDHHLMLMSVLGPVGTVSGDE